MTIRSWRVALSGMAIAGALSACTAPGAVSPPPANPSVITAQTAAARGVIQPTADELTGVQPLTPSYEADHQRDRALIAALRTQGKGAKTGYSRAQYGDPWSDDVTGVLWGHNGCGTRDDVLSRDIQDVTKRGACVVTAGAFTDPYTGTPQRFTKESADRWPADHVFPLALSWQMGASRWSPERRRQLANDPLNLVITTVTANTAKSDSSPAAWLPSNKDIRCAYVTRFTLVALKYQLPVTPADQQTMAAQCR